VRVNLKGLRRVKPGQVMRATDIWDFRLQGIDDIGLISERDRHARFKGQECTGQEYSGTGVTLYRATKKRKVRR